MIMLLEEMITKQLFISNWKWNEMRRWRQKKTTHEKNTQSRIHLAHTHTHIITLPLSQISRKPTTTNDNYCLCLSALSFCFDSFFLSYTLTHTIIHLHIIIIILKLWRKKIHWHRVCVCFSIQLVFQHMHICIEIFMCIFTT